MAEEGIILGAILIGSFLVLTSILKPISTKVSLPYTVAILLSGLAAQFLPNMGYNLPKLTLSPELIFFIFLPLLLYESASQINYHQFRLQFKTITFLATFGLLLSTFLVGIAIAYFTGLPVGVGILFGSLISATDPLSVLSIFKSLGAPRRLSLIAEGESMLNDAAAVILFRIIQGFIITNIVFSLDRVFEGVLEFLFVFPASLLFGASAAYITAKFIERVDNDPIIETSLTIVVALGSFIIADHFLHLSGVISTVAAGLTMGNIGKTKISVNVKRFIRRFWEFISFISVSLVFFFAALNLNLELFSKNIFQLIAVILIVLIARSISVYLSLFISNTGRLFKNEPNIPLSWQHIINWGGLRGVIPLVLIYSTPDTFVYKDILLTFTLATFIFTLLVNGTTIKPLLIKLGLNLKPKEEEIIEEEKNIFKLEIAKEKLRKLSKEEFDDKTISELDIDLTAEEIARKNKLAKLAKPKELTNSLKIQGLEIERGVLNELYYSNHINENIYFEFEAELDLQSDALEFPEVYTGRGYKNGGLLDSKKTFISRLNWIKSNTRHLPFLKKYFSKARDETISDRYALLRTRTLASEAVIEYLQHVEALVLNNKKAARSVGKVKDLHLDFVIKNKRQLNKLENEFPKICRSYQKHLAYTLTVKT